MWYEENGTRYYDNELICEIVIMWNDVKLSMGLNAPIGSYSGLRHSAVITI